MKLSEYKKVSDTFTSKASDINRQLVFAGIAIIWLFKSSVNEKEYLPGFLLFPLVALIIALIMDVLHYVVGGSIWKTFFLQQERIAIQKHKANASSPLDPDVKAPKYYRIPIYIFYWGKILFMLLSYMLLLIFLMDRMQIN